MKYSIWLMPSEPVFGELNGLISSLAIRYRGPAFKAHMTVVGSVDREVSDIQKAVETVTKNTKKLSLVLGPVSFSTTYFQSVFVRVNSAAELMQINLNILKRLDLENSVFMPHISLLYGNHDMETREKVAAKVKVQNTSFVADNIVIMSDESEPERWKPIVTVPFGGSSDRLNV